MSAQVSTPPTEPGSAGEQPALAKKMRWYDGFAMSLAMPAALIASLGASIGGLGAWGAIALWAASMVLATGASWIYSELAAMFPESSGGIAHYATEGWKQRAPFVGPLASIGYWFAWTTSLSVYAGIIGSLIQAQVVPRPGLELGGGTRHGDLPDRGRHRHRAPALRRGHVRPARRHVGRLRDRRHAADPARRVHLRAVLHRRLERRQPALEPARRKRHPRKRSCGCT
ncbi:amino acid permease [Yinghuangia aomiensis]